MITTLFHAGSTTTTGGKGGGEGGWKGGGHDNDLVSRGQHDHHVEARGTTKIGVPTSAPQPPQRVRGGMVKGGKRGGHDNDLVSRGQHDHHEDGEGGGHDKRPCFTRAARPTRGGARHDQNRGAHIRPTTPTTGERGDGEGGGGGGA